VPGVEERVGDRYRRTVLLPAGPAILDLSAPAPGARAVPAVFWLSDVGDLPDAIRMSRFLLDLDADPADFDAVLAADPGLVPLVAAGPGRRIPRTVDGAELALRVVLGQQVSTKAARTHAARLVQGLGTAIVDPDGGLTHLFPPPDRLAQVRYAELAMPRSRADTFRRLAAVLADRELSLDAGADAISIRRQLLAMPGIGPWTVEVVAMRALGDPDAFPGTDLGVRQALRTLGCANDREGRFRAEHWRPWRSYAVQYLWACVPHEINSFGDDSA
jgi:AraC family transcriptional regulator of adaptative response / DNA-3-methyladenine glycosylase II